LIAQRETRRRGKSGSDTDIVKLSRLTLKRTSDRLDRSERLLGVKLLGVGFKMYRGDIR
jgi:hypothetical protein